MDVLTVNKILQMKSLNTVSFCAASLMALVFCACESTDVSVIAEQNRPVNHRKPVLDLDELESVECDASSEDDEIYVKTEAESYTCFQGDWKETAEVQKIKDSLEALKPIVDPTVDPDNQSTETPDIDFSSGKMYAVIRDFDVSHPDFENYQEEAYNSMMNAGSGISSYRVGSFETWTTPGYRDNAEWMARRSDYMNFGCGVPLTPDFGIAVGASGYPHDLATAMGATSTTPDYVRAALDQSGYAWYGEFSDCRYDAKLNPLGLHIMRGLVGDLCSNNSGTWSSNMKDGDKKCDKICKFHSWSKIVYFTPGMVMQTLAFPQNANGEPDMYNPVISKARSACDNGYFEHWFADVPGVNLTSVTTLELEQDESEPAYFEIDQNRNNGGGFFPLDNIASDNYSWLGQNSKYPNQYGPQGLSIFCPPYAYQWAESQTDFMGDNTATLCESWKMYGGPKVGAAASAVAEASGTIGLRHLRNYDFTMMAYAPFKYKKGAGNIFEFSASGDLWVYIDGVLALDLGGTHLPASGYINLDFLANSSHGCYPGNPLLESCSSKIDEDGVWKDKSIHQLHVFYTNRQAEGADFRMRVRLK